MCTDTGGLWHAWYIEEDVVMACPPSLLPNFENELFTIGLEIMRVTFQIKYFHESVFRTSISFSAVTLDLVLFKFEFEHIHWSLCFCTLSNKTVVFFGVFAKWETVDS